MKYRKLGNTGLIVSEVALGTMQFGGKMNMGNLAEAGSFVPFDKEMGYRVVDALKEVAGRHDAGKRAKQEQ